VSCSLQNDTRWFNSEEGVTIFVLTSKQLWWSPWAGRYSCEKKINKSKEESQRREKTNAKELYKNKKGEERTTYI
jgi:hypothetical protein